MTIEPTILFTILVPAAGGLIWLIRLEGRLNLTESRIDDMREVLDDINADVKLLLQRSYGARSTDQG